MTLTTENKKALIAFTLAGGLLWAILKFGGRKSKNDKQETGDDYAGKKVRPEDVQIAVTAYKEAMMNNEDEATMNALNDRFKKDFRLTVSQDFSTRKYIVKDVSGTTIKIV